MGRRRGIDYENVRFLFHDATAQFALIGVPPECELDAGACDDLLRSPRAPRTMSQLLAQ
jgi:hypothetical protein